jgi:predicted dehydrogenase
MHAAISVTALRAKKHLYLQKPMATTLHECRVITQEAAKAGVVTQLGNQGRSSIESRMTVDLIRSGAIGRIKEVLIWENKPLSWWPKNTELRAHADEIPEGLDWDLWLGVREVRPYLKETYHPKAWRAWFDFGCGEMGDMGCHHFDITFDALKLTAPLRVKQLGAGSSGPLWGESRQVELIFPGSDITAEETVKVTWHDGEVRPDLTRIQLPKGVNEVPESGSFWIGEKGGIFKNYRGGRPFVLPEESFPAANYPRGYKGQDHYHDWVDAVLEGRKACDDFSHGGPLTETVLVGAMADRFAGEWLEWDAAKQVFTNSAEGDPTGEAGLPRWVEGGGVGLRLCSLELLHFQQQFVGGEKPWGEREGIEQMPARAGWDLPACRSWANWKWICEGLARIKREQSLVGGDGLLGIACLSGGMRRGLRWACGETG